jgi:hypothetical protein
MLLHLASPSQLIECEGFACQSSTVLSNFKSVVLAPQLEDSWTVGPYGLASFQQNFQNWRLFQLQILFAVLRRAVRLWKTYNGCAVQCYFLVQA